jgi:hypothetical protein
MLLGMPILRHDNGLKFGHQLVDPRNDCITVVHRQFAARAKVVLDVDDQQGMGSAMHGELLSACPSVGTGLFGVNARGRRMVRQDGSVI